MKFAKLWSCANYSEFIFVIIQLNFLVITHALIAFK